MREYHSDDLLRNFEQSGKHQVSVKGDLISTCNHYFSILVGEKLRYAL